MRARNRRAVLTGKDVSKIIMAVYIMYYDLPL